jgi:hypothetical protein
MEETKIIDIKNYTLSFLAFRGSRGALLGEIQQNYKPFKVNEPELKVYLDELYMEGYINKSSLSKDQIKYTITSKGDRFSIKGGYSIGHLTDHLKETSKKEVISHPVASKKVLPLFISYSHKNINKVNLIIKELKDHPKFKPLVVANNREPNKALVKKVTEGIKSAYRVIVILTKESKNEQWINQEIGYAIGKKTEVIPIIEQSLLKKDVLKGFIHNQNDCPYTYQTRTGLLMREENKLFMGQFRLLIKDLEEKIKNESVYVEDHSIKKGSHLIRTTTPLLPLGTIVSSGERCPQSGVWETITDPFRTVSIRKGNKMPFIDNEMARWKIVDYKLVEQA